MLTFHLDTYPQSFLPLIYCPVDDTLFKVSPDLCSFRYVKLPLQLWKQHSWFCANLKTFHCSHLIIEQDLSLPKIISKCELLELCHINHRGQVFFEAQCRHKQMDSEGWHPGWAKRVLLHPGIPSSNCTFDWTFLTT